MCGIVGCIAERNVASVLLEGLKRLEYRGYDSAGMAILSDAALLQCIRTQGKVSVLAEKLGKQPIAGKVGVAHTRWATHGNPNERNAHPQCSSDKIAVVHNGIIENHMALKAELLNQGYPFESETDTEVIAHLFHYHLSVEKDDATALKQLAQKLKGAFAIGLLDQARPDRIYALRSGSPLVIGLGLEENFIASDPLALSAFCQQFIYLEDGDLAVIERGQVSIFDAKGKAVEREVKTLDLKPEAASRGKYRHYMEKEIFEQPVALANTLSDRLHDQRILSPLWGKGIEKKLAAVKTIHIIACGTSYHAGLVASFWLEQLAGIPVRVEIASEYRYRDIVVQQDTLLIAISQSGETADVLAALEAAKSYEYLATLAICNVPESSVVRMSDWVMLTRAGPEIGVASTKAFVTQLASLLMLSGLVLSAKQQATELLAELTQQLSVLPRQVEHALELNQPILELATTFVDKQHALFLGRGCHYPVALEGALKLKELSYIHAEAYPAGELKHGPLALVDKEMPVIVIAPTDELLEKLRANIHEVEARGGQLFIFSDDCSIMGKTDAFTVLQLPKVDRFISPIVYTIPLQLLAYHVAVLKGTDVDQPRNLAKSVTVE